MSISIQTLDQRIMFRHPILQRKLDPLGLKPQAGIVSDVTGAAPSGFGTREPVAVTTEGLKTLLGLDVILSASVPNRLGGDKEKLAVSVKLDTPPDQWPVQVARGVPETKRLLDALYGLYALRNKLDTLLGRPAEGELKALIEDPTRAKAVLAELAGGDPPAAPAAPKAGKKS